MKNRLLNILIGIVVFTFSSYASNETSGNEDPFVVVLDAGHGGKDPGAIGKHAKEKDIALAITLKAGEYIEENIKNVKVIYTRKTDVYPELWERAEIANKNKAKLIISIHVNFNPSPRPFGTSTHVFGFDQNDKNFEVAKRENSVIMLEEDYKTKYVNFDPNSPESFIIFSVMQNSYFNQSLEMATMIQDQFRERAQRHDRGVKQQPLLVLAQSSMPGVLIETGFISNPKEEAYLMSENGQDYLASAIYRAFKDYKKIIDSKSNIASINSTNNNIDLESAPISKKEPIDNEDIKPEKKITETKPDERIEENNLSAEEINKTETNDSTIYYRIQISSSYAGLDIDSPFFKGLKDVDFYQNEDLFKYVTGKEESYTKIKAYLTEVKEKFPDAFIVAVKKGKIISLQQAFKESGLKNNNIN